MTMYEKIYTLFTGEGYINPVKLPDVLKKLEIFKYQLSDDILLDYDYSKENLKEIYREIIRRFCNLEEEHKIQDRIYEAKYRWMKIKNPPRSWHEYEERFFRRR
jgi:hypothetical protein